MGSALKDKASCWLKGHDMQSVEVCGSPVWVGNYVETFFVYTHVFCARCGKVAQPR